MNNAPSRLRDTRWSKGLTITGIVIAVLNMMLAWTIMFSGPTRHHQIGSRSSESSQSMRDRSTVDPSTKEKQLKESIMPPEIKPENLGYYQGLLADLFEGLRYFSEVEERSTTLILGFCFALISIGFSLFVMGIEGAISLKGDTKDFGSLLIKTSSPGLFCILLASILVCVSLVGSSENNEVAKVRADARAKQDILQAEARTKQDVLQAEVRAKQDVLQAEARAKQDVLQAEAFSKEYTLRAEGFAKESVLRTEAQAKQDVLREERLAKERLLNPKFSGNTKK